MDRNGDIEFSNLKITKTFAYRNGNVSSEREKGFWLFGEQFKLEMKLEVNV